MSRCGGAREKDPGPTGGKSSRAEPGSERRQAPARESAGAAGDGCACVYRQARLARCWMSARSLMSSKALLEAQGS